MLENGFTRPLGCQVPIRPAGMGGIGPPELAAAVSEAGGIGLIAIAGVTRSATQIAPR